MIHSLAIIGGGISGTLTVLNCIKQSTTALKIIWFDAHHQFCKGLAYSTSNEHHLLNVRAANMSAFAEEPEHFVNWLKQHHPHYTPTDFVPRKIFGNYLQDTFEVLKNINSLVTIQQIAEEVLAINKTETTFEIKTTTTYQAQKVVLAFGNFLPAHPHSASKEFIASPNYFQNAFHAGIAHQLNDKKNITIIGSGLTMIDVIMSLSVLNYNGTIQIVSPHAYIPQAHLEKPLPVVKPFIEEEKAYQLSELLSLVNSQLKKAVKEGLSLQSVIDVMRPHLQFIWLHFSLEERKRFLRHLRHKWGVARHRAPEKSMEVFKQLQSSGKLTLIKGRVYDIKTTSPDFEIHFTDYKSQAQCIKTNLIINCTGPESDYEKIQSTLVQYLIKTGLINPDSIRYGINAAQNGEISSNLYTLGPPLKGVLWESTAVPEIRLQAKELASKIIFN
ncbi:MAG: FAD/NAD(P)-binding protein [Bacteroidota bacterium]